MLKQLICPLNHTASPGTMRYKHENVFIEMLLSKNEIWDHTAKHIESAANGTNKKNAATKPLRTFRAQWLCAAAAVSGIILLAFAFSFL